MYTGLYTYIYWLTISCAVEWMLPACMVSSSNPDVDAAAWSKSTARQSQGLDSGCSKKVPHYWWKYPINSKVACKIGNMGKWPVKMSHCGVPGRRFYTQTLLHTSQFYFSFWRSNLISCERDVRKGRAGQVEIAILPQFLPIEPHFVRKGCAGQVEIVI